MRAIIADLSQHRDLVTTWTAIAAIFMSLISIAVTLITMRMQRVHYRKSLLPIGNLSLGDYENKIFVLFRNDGVGPLIIDKVSIRKNGHQDEIGSALIELMPELPEGVNWTTFVKDIRGRAFATNREIYLLLFEGKLSDPKFVDSRQKIRSALSNLCVKIEYHSVYGEHLAAERRLDWFGRNVVTERIAPLV